MDIGIFKMYSGVRTDGCGLNSFISHRMIYFQEKNLKIDRN